MGLIKTAAKVAVASSVHGRVQRRQQDRWARQDQAAQAVPQVTPAAPPSPVTPPAPASTDMDTKLTQLAQLGQLRDAGILSEIEFEVKKAEILRS